MTQRRLSLLGLVALLLAVAWSTPHTAFAECKVLSSTPTYAAGDLKDNVCDTSGREVITPGTLSAGEDLAATGAFAGGVVVVEPRYVTAGVKTADFQVKATPGFLHCIILAPADGAPTAGQIDLYDNTAESGTKIFHYEVVVTTMFAPIQVCPDVTMATGIYLGFTTTADVNVTVSYR